MVENGTISLLIEREANYPFVSLSIRNDIVPFSSVYTETFHAIFKSYRFKNRPHLVPVTKKF